MCLFTCIPAFLLVCLLFLFVCLFVRSFVCLLLKIGEKKTKRVSGTGGLQYPAVVEYISVLCARLFVDCLQPQKQTKLTYLGDRFSVGIVHAATL